MKKRQLFSVGDLNVDIFQELSTKPVFGEEYLLNDLVFSIGGCAANFSVIAAKTGLKPVLVSVLGKDFATPFIKKQLSKAGVETLLLKSNKKNSFSMFLIKKDGERAIESIKNCFEDVTSKKFAKLLLPKVRRGDVVSFGGFYNLENLRPGFASFLKKLKKKGAIVTFDTSFDPQKKWTIDSFLPFIDYLFVSQNELPHIAKGRNTAQRINSLFRKGTRVVLLKQGRKGSSLFVKGFKPQKFEAIKLRAVNTTGAGDSFNAGFVFGLMHGYSLNNCMKAGNFVAAETVKVHGLAAPKIGALQRFIAINNKPTLVVVRNHDEMSRVAAQRVINLVKRKPNASLLLPTGSTPKQMYSLLSQAYSKGRVSFARASFFNLDDYAGLSQKDKSSFAFFLRRHLFSKINAKRKNIRLLDGAAKNLKAEAAKHEDAIRRKGVDLCILGIAPNGHIGFNEPGCCPYSITRVVKLKQATRRKNRADFPGSPVPKKGITVGVRTMRDNSNKIILIASGKGKASAVASSLQSKDSMKWPAAALRPHKNFMFIVDKAAASKVKK